MLVAIRAAREHFISHCCLVDRAYDPQWFHRIIALKLEQIVRRVEAGESPRLMITLPPRHGKSDEVTQKFASWVLGHHPEWPIIVASYAADLATLFGQKTRDIMNSANYQAAFATRLRDDSQAKSNWMTAIPDGRGGYIPAGGGYAGVGIGGPITGRGFKIGIVDDPFKNWEEADSPVIRENVWNWWRSTFYTRQEGNAAIIVINTRWHEDDLSGKLEKEQQKSEDDEEENFDRWEHLNFAALAEKDELPHRRAGQPLWPAKFSKEKLERIKKALGSYLFSAMYQQDPYGVDTMEFREDWIKKRLWVEVEKMHTRKFATIDTALGKKRKQKPINVEEGKNTPDYTGVTRNYVDLGNNYNFKSQRYEVDSAGLVKLIFELHDEGFEKIGIEEGAYKEAVEPFLKIRAQELGKWPNVVTLKHHETMKETRIRGLIPRYEAGKVFHIVGHCDDLEAEQRRFPHSTHDDCMDSAAYQLQIAEPPSLEESTGDESAGMYDSQNFT